MEDANREVLYSVLIRGSDKVPDSIAADTQAVDWLFHGLLTKEYPSVSLIHFLWRHFPDDRRFVHWKNRAFRPGLGEDGMASQTAYTFIEKHEPGHPWLNPLMEQAAYGFFRLSECIYLGKDFSRHLKSRFEVLLGSYDPCSKVDDEYKRLASEELAEIAADLKVVAKDRLVAIDQLFERSEFEILLCGKFDFIISQAVINRMKMRPDPHLLDAAEAVLNSGENLSLSIEILLAHCTSVPDFVRLSERAIEMRQGRTSFLDAIERFGASIPPSLALKLLIAFGEGSPYLRGRIVPLLLTRCSTNPEVINRIKEWAKLAPDEYSFSQILNCMLDSSCEKDWVRQTALEYEGNHNGCSSIFNILGRIGDDACLQTILNASDSPLSIESEGAIQAGGIYFYQNSKIKSKLLEGARKGSVSAMQWIAWRYPKDPESVEILKARISRQGELIRVMGIQEILLPEMGKRFLKSLEDPSTGYRFDCDDVLANRAEREKLTPILMANWERLSFQSAEFSNIFPIWFSWEPMMDQLIAAIQSGEHLPNFREVILGIAGIVDVSEALREGINAGADQSDQSDAILLLGLIYGDRSETIRYLKQFVEYEPAMLKYGAETAFAEVIRLGNRDFQWAVAALENSRRKPGGIAAHGPAILVHFFGSGPQVINALHRLALLPEHPHLAEAATLLLLKKFPFESPLEFTAAAEGLPSDGRARVFQQLDEARFHYLREIKHFAIHDPQASVRQAALGNISWWLQERNNPSNWQDREFLMDCLQHEELAFVAAQFFAKWLPEDEEISQSLVDAATRFPDAKIPRILAASFGHTRAAHSLLIGFVRDAQMAASALVTPPRCNCRGCLGFDCDLYAAIMLRLLLPPFDQDEEASKLTCNFLQDRWMKSSQPWEFIKVIKALTFGLGDIEMANMLEKVIRGEALEFFKSWASDALARLAAKNDEALDALLKLLDDPDEGIRRLVAKSSKSIALNERRNHRILHDLLRNI